MMDLFDKCEYQKDFCVQATPSVPEDNMRSTSTHDSFVCTKGQLMSLVDTVNSIGPVRATNFERIGHVGKITLSC